MGIHHLLTYNISIQYVPLIYVHIKYSLCTCEVKIDEKYEKCVVCHQETEVKKDEPIQK